MSYSFPAIIRISTKHPLWLHMYLLKFLLSFLFYSLFTVDFVLQHILIKHRSWTTTAQRCLRIFIYGRWRGFRWTYGWLKCTVLDDFVLSILNILGDFFLELDLLNFWVLVESRVDTARRVRHCIQIIVANQQKTLRGRVSWYNWTLVSNLL
jgi:hypothetical protein